MTPGVPDILWIVTTQWRGQALGYAGDVNASTPCLDRLAARSMNYRQAVTPHPFGPWARAAMLTGVSSPENGIRDYFDPLPRDAQTIAHRLRAMDYSTAFFGKWHLSARDPNLPLVGEAHARLVVDPDARGGFDCWEGFEGGFLLNDPWLHGTRLATPQRFAGYQADVLARRTTDWILDRYEADAGSVPEVCRPWFAIVSLEAPHPPYDAPASEGRAVDPANLILGPNVSRGGDIEAQARRELAGYYRHISATDRAIGALVAAVDAAASRVGRPAPLIVFTSVHGDMHGAHGLFRKGWPYEESVRVPLLVRRPDASAGFSDEAISLLDLLPLTLAWATGRSSPPRPAASRISMPSVVALPHQCDRPWRGIRTANRKLILSNDRPWLFFDLATDPDELRNLADDPGRAAEIAELRRTSGL